MAKEIREGYYKDRYGNWQGDRRGAQDRRGHSSQYPLDHEHRKMYRRKADRELLTKDHKVMIEEALEDFAEDHDGHL